ncbi:MAG: hypothetical protein WC100_01755 [Sterolibacterium sp.]
MTRVVPRSIRYKPEELICYGFAEQMRILTLSGKYKGIWLHIPNEGKRGKVNMLMLIVLGMIPGAPDYIFAGPWGACCIEFKTPRRERFNAAMKKVIVPASKQTVEQKYFQQWCDAEKVPYALCHSAEEALAFLKTQGAISI